VLTVRSATVADARPIANLTVQLGYIRTESEITEELMIATGETRIQVIVAEDDGVVGFAALSIWRAFAERAWVCRLSAITVDCSARRSGVGRALMEEVEVRARRAGCELMELSSGRHPERQAAHEFYQSLGWSIEPPIMPDTSKFSSGTTAPIRRDWGLS
jgi:GNAT superfamily N-acetyltransferase